MLKKKILVIPGDGIGMEVTAVGKAVLKQIAADNDYQFEFEDGMMGHTAIEATGDPLPDETLNKGIRPHDLSPVRTGTDRH